jgi:hypothetical protein
VVRKTINKQIFTRRYADVFKGDSLWRKIGVKGGLEVVRGADLPPVLVVQVVVFVGALCGLPGVGASLQADFERGE